MRLTNKTNLPIPLYEALRNDDYTRGQANISATGLIAPARKVALEELHAAVLEEDAADHGARLIGKAVHFYIWFDSVKRQFTAVVDAARQMLRDPIGGIAALATAVKQWDLGLDNFNDNKRLMMSVAGWVVSGQSDNAEDTITTTGGRIKDYKTVAVNVYLPGKIHDDRMHEFECQLNTYAELMRSNGYPPPTGLTVCLIFKDHSATQAAYGGDYPPNSIVEMDVPLWPREQAQAYIMERVLAHQAARAELPECSDEERWLRDTKWAVMKGGAARAIKLHDDKEAAALHAAELQAKEPRVPYSVEFRPGTPTRCLYFCTPGRMGLCDQFNQWRADNEIYG